MKLNSLFFVWLLFFVSIKTHSQSATYIKGSPTKIYNVSSTEFYEQIHKKEKAQIIDIRTFREYAAGHIKGSILIDFYNPEFVKNIEKTTLDKNEPVFVYCRSGNRSRHAMRFFKQLGFKEVYNLKYGIIEWVRNGYKIKYKI